MKHFLRNEIRDGLELKEYGNLGFFRAEDSDLMSACIHLRNTYGCSLMSIVAFDERADTGFFKIAYFFGVPGRNLFIAPYVETTELFPSIESEFAVASLYERRIQTFFGLKAVGLSDKRPLILHENWPHDVHPLRKEFARNERPDTAHETYEFHEVHEEGIYEVPVGPVHAGIIEPGHFRFSMRGEEIVNLEPRLGYQHKGTEKLFENTSLEQGIRLAERISGDSSCSHSLAYCEAIEKLAHIAVPERAQHLRVIYAELERLANHLGDIGAIMVDTGYNFGGSHGARLRERVMQMAERLTKNRFLRGVHTIGGVTIDIDGSSKRELLDFTSNLREDFDEVIAIARDSVSLLGRLKKTGIVSPDVAVKHGALGVAGRAAGIERDTRRDFPYEAYAKFPLAIHTETYGDVYSRFNVRIHEVRSSLALIEYALAALPQDDIVSKKKVTLPANSYALSVVEGWRGEIVYVVSTDTCGAISRVAPRDPSFHNWPIVGIAGRGNMLPDFPLINKSFNLSYSGNDL